MTESAPASSNRIFISYRREDAAYPAGWLFDRLENHFGRGQVFKDVDSIQPGDDFVAEITAAVGSCAVLLAVIGPRWLAVSGEEGRRRLDDPDDFVRLEIEAAFTRDVRVIPILVDRARMPRIAELPASLAQLARRQAVELSPNQFGSDTDRLLKVLDRQRKAQAEAERKARQDAERQARGEAARKAQAEAERKARKDAERQAREEAARKAQAEAERKARKEDLLSAALPPVQASAVRGRAEHAQPRLLGGRYELDGIVGRGGMAEVYRARDIRLDRVVAVKTLREDLARDQTFQARFRREAQSAASLDNPSIVAVYDTGEDVSGSSHMSYIVMEYVDGRTLRDLLRDDRRLLPERALEITDGVLRALDYSHRNGIVHRDIKPGNVMLTRSGDVKVMDFGIARAVSDAQATMTQTAQVIGTAQYLSPEQAQGERVDARSDLYSTGCLLYELLTGRPPFLGDSPVAIAYQHVRENPIPPSRIDPEVPQWADAIVLRAMAKDPRDRYQSAVEMRTDIQRALQGMPVGGPRGMGYAPAQQIESAPKTAGAPGWLRRLAGGRPEPEPQPTPPEVKLVRQQRVRQSRSKRSGKR